MVSLPHLPVPRHKRNSRSTHPLARAKRLRPLDLDSMARLLRKGGKALGGSVAGYCADCDRCARWAARPSDRIAPGPCRFAGALGPAGEFQSPRKPRVKCRTVTRVMARPTTAVPASISNTSIHQGHMMCSSARDAPSTLEVTIRSRRGSNGTMACWACNAFESRWDTKTVRSSGIRRKHPDMPAMRQTRRL